MSRRSPDALVVGGGVSGLTTAVCLADAGYSVRVWAADRPADTTSYAAGAIYSPFLIEDERVSEWADQTFAELEALAREDGTGVAMVFGREVCRTHAEAPPWALRVPDFRMCDPEELPPGFASGWSYTVPVVDMPVYLAYLEKRLAERGGSVERRRITSLAEAAAAAPVVANCTGMGARELVPDPRLQPIRGELVVVSNPGITSFVAEHNDTERELTYLLPHRDFVVLGGSAEKDRVDRDRDHTVAAGIIARCVEIEPLLKNAEVIDHRVGIRPAREPVRVERTTLAGSAVLHNYGHGGAGVSISWGCARYAVSLLA
ncbi:FAD-dependent oxidoreductase [Actinoplanes sp. URMC 104]|uniref:FAD-dependent oxidoreductase n=1 Tax=Actinoplanes sp. URMC 104 TaxID=3423409 RepID=UPI003F19434B